MSDYSTPLGQPIGAPLPDWKGALRPLRQVLQGRTVRVEPLDPRAHAADIFAADHDEKNGHSWAYLPYGPFDDFDEYQSWVSAAAAKDDPLFFAIVDLRNGKAVGLAALMRIDPANGSIEVGNIHFSPRLQGTTQATEAMYLLMRHAFEDLGYRRYEWKCDDLNAPSRRAAERFGFTYEGTFRQAVVYRGRNRDTAWFSIIDREWPRLKAGFEAWLDPGNFEADGRQIKRLEALRVVASAVA